MLAGSNSVLIRVWITLSLFLFSLGSFYFYGLELYAFQVLGIALALPLLRPHFFDFQNYRLHLLVLFFCFAFFVGASSAALTGAQAFTFAKLSLPVFFFMWLGFAAIMFQGYAVDFYFALRAVIWVHVGVFIFQFVWFLATGTFIDFLAPVTGEEQRAFGGDYEIAIFPVFFRATGLFNEPGTYSTWIVVMLLLLRATARRLGIAREGRLLEVLSIGTVLLSFSTFGIVFSVLYILMVTFDKKVTVGKIVAVGLMSLPFAVLVIEYLVQRSALGSDSAGLGFRYQAMELYFSGLTPKSLLIGLGMFTDFFSKVDPELVYVDVGLWFVILSSVGVVGSMMLASYLLLSVPRQIVPVTLVAVVLLSKLPLTNPLVWFVFAYFLWSGISQSANVRPA